MPLHHEAPTRVPVDEVGELVERLVALAGQPGGARAERHVLRERQAHPVGVDDDLELVVLELRPELREQVLVERAEVVVAGLELVDVPLEVLDLDLLAVGALGQRAVPHLQLVVARLQLVVLLRADAPAGAEHRQGLASITVVLMVTRPPSIS
ncbi:MAG: hypothetical protein R3F59_33110 [Myxococcota bacterium]